MIARALVGALLVLAAWTGAAAGASGSLVGLQPLTPDQSWIVGTAAPGEVVRAGAVLINLSGRRQEVSLGAADGITTADGVFTLSGEGVEPVGVGAWIDAPAGRLTLAPRERRVVRFRIRVPADAEPGDHAGGLVVQSASAARVSSGSGVAVRVVERVGLRVYLTVTGARDATLAVEGLSARATSTGGLREAVGLPGRVEIDFTVRHLGNVRFDDLAGVVELRAGGDVVGRARTDLGTLLPGGDRRVALAMPLPRWSPTAYEVSVRLGDAPGALATTRLPADPARPVATAGLLLAVAGTGLWSLRRRAG